MVIVFKKESELLFNVVKVEDAKEASCLYAYLGWQ